MVWRISGTRFLLPLAVDVERLVISCLEHRWSQMRPWYDAKTSSFCKPTPVCWGPDMVATSMGASGHEMGVKAH